MKSKIVTYKMEAGKFQWELAPGKIIEAWGYNNQLPGPVLKAQKGDTLVGPTEHGKTPSIYHPDL